MTTLTQDTLLRPDHCPHKLPTSCRLTARPTCCACQDDRPHAPTYRKYIDGVGYVMLGTRQDGYCWPCKVFWDYRISVAGMEPQQARIPYIPDQTSFVNTWHDWHRGFRVIMGQDGESFVLPLHGQPLRDIPIGELPFPVDGSSATDERAVEWLPRLEMSNVAATSQQEEIEILDEDNLFDSSEDDQPVNAPQNRSELPRPGRNVTSSSENSGHRNLNSLDTVQQPSLTAHFAASDARNLKSLLRRLESQSSSIESSSHRLQYVLDLAGLSGSRHGEIRQRLRRVKELAEQLVQQCVDLARHQPLLQLTRMLVRPQVYEDVNTDRFDPSPQSQIPTRNETPMPTSQRVPNEHRVSERARLIRQQRNAAVSARQAAALGTREDVQQDTYQSPINLMFDRANQYASRLQRERMEAERTSTLTRQHAMPEDMHLEYEPSPRGFTSLPRRRDAVESHGPSQPLSPPRRQLESAEMCVQLQCSICQEQIADIALVPCGHLVMCRWCSDRQSKITDEWNGRRVGSSCPVCRTHIQHRLRIWGIDGNVRHDAAAADDIDNGNSESR